MTQLNVLCDASAKEKARQQPGDEIPFEVFSDMWQIRIGGQVIVHKTEETLREWIHDPRLKEYWKEIGKITNESANLIDWDAIKRASRGVNKRTTITMTKMLSDNAPTNDNMVKWGFRQCEKCPRCGHEIETADHVVRCQEESAIEVWECSLRKLNTWLHKQQTDPQIRHYLIRVLRQWKKGEQLPSATGQLAEVIAEQEVIGWDRCMFGFISKRWAMLQQERYKKLGSRRDGRRWAAAIIQKLWDITWDQWNQRNSILHAGDRLTEYHDPDQLEEDIRLAFNVGIPPSCPAKYRRWFRFTSVDQILCKPAFDQRLWLQSVALIRNKLMVPDDETQQMHGQMMVWLRGSNPHL